MVDCHSFFDVRWPSAWLAGWSRKRLTWYEEPVPPEA